jgi:hypothetical protein
VEAAMTNELRCKSRFRRGLLPLAVFVAGMLGWDATALAQSTIRRPGVRPHYKLELEPHLLVTPFDAPGSFSGNGIGGGIRATIEVAREGFIPAINDSVGVGFGIDAVHYLRYDAYETRCVRYVRAPAGTRVCTEIEWEGGDRNYLFSMAVMQWNFWLHKKWSVFGEPGLGFYLGDADAIGLMPTLYAGGRYHFNDRVTLTLRLGYPAFSVGASFLF